MVVVGIAIGDDTSSRSATALTPRSLSAHEGFQQGAYVAIVLPSRRPRYFRLTIAQDSCEPGPIEIHDKLVIDHWPEYHDDNEPVPSPVEAHVSVIPPTHIKVAQYVELTSVGADNPPKLPQAMALVLLKKQILHGKRGLLRLHHENIDYGYWQYKAYYRGRHRRRREDPAAMDGGESDVDIGIVNEETMIMMMPLTTAPRERTVPLQPVGSHGQYIFDLISLALYPPSTLNPVNDSMEQPRSLLLHGPSGSGKSTLVELISNELGVNLFPVDATMLSNPNFRLEHVFQIAKRIQPCIILVEDLELLFPRALDETKYKLICRFVACMEQLGNAASTRVIVVGVVTAMHALNASVRRIFEEEAPLEVPSKEWTMKLFGDLMPKPDTISDDIKHKVAVKFGQRPSQIVDIARQMLIRWSEDELLGMGESKLNSEIEKFGRGIASSTSGTAFHSLVPDVTWDDIGGLDSVKQSLMETVVWPLEKPEVFRRMGISPPMGMLLHGPPGTGKTMLAKAAARASGCNFLNLAASDLMKAEFGESEKAITRVFDTARALGPCMVFIDEFQSLFGNRTIAGATTSRMISQLLMEMDSIKAVSDDSNAEHSTGDRVFVLAATNALSAIDPAFLQPGRFENILCVDLPNHAERRAILELQKTRMPWSQDIDTAALADATEGANAASVVALCQSAAIKAMQQPNEDIQSQRISMADFKAALETGKFWFDDEVADESDEFD